ncbi:uncharacterized protein L969DRAFT_52197 [Mixia osmundae IAM 14324]|uniref:Uncharacterized protein n=1 Tax=Mixia osmundae (strain CBS 9802 / IAM 14324 / JCM 22182 / KY 12970) TaxID=764103 RepID=G7DWT4_MIXOS|nr:uncharacterized protein L969DRAFT_55532 [Mixia osmundae IAM 14324]XP_014566722.1 uncharacterized protein L969DRAFT_52197 [Mixia osmundae IAM 14324]KEI36191.1 hypothetical protein L969DRAFT_55532 [Mixia osmundae IAM 14324]KEI38159.1 hypothetical protein L969DRAFT_52197 [Mixia osmundae IAM 14324]GAA95031.1 hypothetical protein E5Q_01686 [Mixia osmundae IAM 14324]
MPLDANLYTLDLKPITQGVALQHHGDVVYLLRAPHDSEESLTLYDGATEAQLASLVYVTVRARRITLVNPTQHVQMEVPTGALSALKGFRWTFRFENLKFYWDREVVLGSQQRSYSLWLRRAPEPDWQLMICKPARASLEADEGLAATLTILDYNLNRAGPAEMEDRKGFELVALITLASFLAPTIPSIAPPTVPVETARKTPAPVVKPAAAAAKPGLTTPSVPRPKPRSPVPTATNEITVSEHSETVLLLKQADSILRDPTIVFIKLLAQGGAVPIAVKLASEIKRQILKQRGGDLWMYLVDTRSSKTLPTAANTDTGLSRTLSKLKSYKQPETITIYLSRMPLAELDPKKAK